MQVNLEMKQCNRVVSELFVFRFMPVVDVLVIQSSLELEPDCSCSECMQQLQCE